MPNETPCKSISRASRINHIHNWVSDSWKNNRISKQRSTMFARARLFCFSFTIRAFNNIGHKLTVFYYFNVLNMLMSGILSAFFTLFC